ncbi:hypothetical protein LL037_21635 [Clostridium estertheticum]|uniref:hypothetical protein n=1 Tax=Clostridium estertheticum TaxID=238834 RepID=UPI001C0DAF0E|nr:hypothetical protein [Clostridium estertheticum]MBU3198346.1 hypothetical protein [Clostridium estertheticum]WAG65031.1 hypothetical protein LL037_21635 [Clostridium estertheticum]
MHNILHRMKTKLKKRIIKPKRSDYLQKIYERNPTTGNYVIQVGIDKYTDIFNDWDNAPFRKRDMDPDLVIFLENCFEEIPEKYGVDICFYLPKGEKDISREESLIAGIKTYYSFYLHQEIKILNNNYRKIFKYVLIALSLLGVSVFLGSSGDKNIILGTIQQGFNIGGWVFLWEVISMVFFPGREVSSEISKYQRFLNSLIYFKYGNENPLP